MKPTNVLQRLYIYMYLAGHDVREPGEPCGNGLTEEAATELGLNVGTAVATSLLDAHAGGIGNSIMSCTCGMYSHLTCMVTSLVWSPH